MVPTISALRRRGNEIVEQVLRGTVALGVALRGRPRAARHDGGRGGEPAAHEPTRRLRGAAGEGTSYRYVHALHELFGLEAALAPQEAAPAEVAHLDARRKRRGR